MAFIIDASVPAIFDMPYVIEFIKSIIVGFDVSHRCENIRIGVVLYGNDEASVHLYLDNDLDYAAITEVIDRLSGRANAIPDNLPLALSLLRNVYNPNRGDRPGVPNRAFLITDGVPEQIVEESVTNAIMLHQANIELIPIGIGHGVDPMVLKALASTPDQIFCSDSFRDLPEMAGKIVETTCRETGTG